MKKGLKIFLISIGLLAVLFSLVLNVYSFLNSKKNEIEETAYKTGYQEAQNNLVRSVFKAIEINKEAIFIDKDENGKEKKIVLINKENPAISGEVKQ